MDANKDNNNSETVYDNMTMTASAGCAPEGLMVFGNKTEGVWCRSVILQIRNCRRHEGIPPRSV
ncbi:UNVERIFIED_CONTAM: hypothetical protein NCL1_47932 [Trichonephila clavipes]